MRPCPFDGCAYETQDQGKLALHSRLHRNVTAYPCTVEHCDAVFTELRYLIAHTQEAGSGVSSHHGTSSGGTSSGGASSGRSASSGHSASSSTASTPGSKSRRRYAAPLWLGGSVADDRPPFVRSLERSFQCDFESCSYASFTSGDLAMHQRIHLGESMYTCDNEDCSYVCTEARHLVSHKNTHRVSRNLHYF